MSTKIIGKVSATEKCPSTIDDFYFWTDKKEILSPFDIVKVEHEQGSITYGVVEEINHVTLWFPVSAFDYEVPCSQARFRRLPLGRQENTAISVLREAAGKRK